MKTQTQTPKQRALTQIHYVARDMAEHAARCTRCAIPILDAEGNPGYVGEACQRGAELIRLYRKLETQYFNTI